MTDSNDNDYYNQLTEKLRTYTEKETGDEKKGRNDTLRQLAYLEYTRNRPIESMKWYSMIEPKDISIYNSLSYLHVHHGDKWVGYMFAQRSLELEYNKDVAYDLGCFYKDALLYDKAIEMYNSVLIIDPMHVKAMGNMASLYGILMLHDKSYKCYDDVYKLTKLPKDYSNLVMCTYYIPNVSPIKRRYMLELVDPPYQTESQHKTQDQNQNITTTQRRIDPEKVRIGYIGYDFNKKNSPVTCFVNHILKNHSHTFDIYVYQASTEASTSNQPSGTSFYTYSIKRSATGSIQTKDLTNHTDEEAALLIQKDKIDILIELMHHTAGNRLGILAYRPAPIQVSYCAFPGTTNTSFLDYKILDQHTAYMLKHQYFSEKPLIMNGGYHCFVPTYKFPSSGYIPHKPVHLFCSNNTKKINKKVIRTWISVLEKVPESILFLRHYNLSSSYSKTRMLSLFRRTMDEMGVSFDLEKKVRIMGYESDYTKVLSMFCFMDIYLDTFPYTATTVACESLMMGVPVVTLMGAQSHERVCGSLLLSAGLDEYVTCSEKEYVEKIVSLCREKGLKSEERREAIRDKVKNSILGNEHLFLKEYERVVMKSIHDWNQKREGNTDCKSESLL